MGSGSWRAKVLVECLAGTPRRFPRQRPRPLESFRELIERRKRSNKRIVRLRLFPNRYEQKTLFDIGLACARLWNELSYEKRRVFFNRELTIMKGMRSTRNTTTDIKRFSVLMLARLLIRMTRLGTPSSSN